MSDFTPRDPQPEPAGHPGVEAAAGKADLVNTRSTVEPGLVITFPESQHPGGPGADAVIGQGDSGDAAMINPTPHSEG